MPTFTFQEIVKKAKDVFHRRMEGKVFENVKGQKAQFSEDFHAAFEDAVSSVITDISGYDACAVCGGWHPESVICDA